MNVKLVQFQNLQRLNITPKMHVDWVRESFLGKKDVLLPKKISLTIRDDVFFNFMPSILPAIDTTGLKVVTRIPGRTPSLQAQIFVYDEPSGDLSAIMDGTYITTMRTGAVATLSTLELAVPDFYEVGMIGLGNCGRAYLNCLFDTIDNKKLLVKLYRYKLYADEVIKEYANYQNITFRIVDTYEEIISGSDVIVSAVTYADKLFCDDDSLYKKGCLLVPIHTRGFQNCDLFFDKVIVDDISHICSFKNFDKFKNVYEISDVLDGTRLGRESNEERIIAYDIGLSIHDLLFARKYLDIIKEKKIDTETVCFDIPDKKIWVNINNTPHVKHRPHI